MSDGDRHQRSSIVTSLNYVSDMRRVVASLVPVVLKCEDREEALAAIREAVAV